MFHYKADFDQPLLSYLLETKKNLDCVAAFQSGL